MNSINKSYIRNSAQDLNNFRCTTASTHSALTKSRSLMTKINRPLYEAHPRGLRPTNKAVNKPLFSAPASDRDCNLYRPTRSEDCMWRTHRALWPDDTQILDLHIQYQLNDWTLSRTRSPPTQTRGSQTHSGASVEQHFLDLFYFRVTLQGTTSSLRHLHQWAMTGLIH